MAGLQRSAVSFRRQGSSGLVWDDKLLSGELNRLAADQKDCKTQRSAAEPVESTLGRSRSDRGFRTGRVSPAVEPPSPRVSACGCFGVLGRDSNTRRRPPMPGKRVA